MGGVRLCDLCVLLPYAHRYHNIRNNNASGNSCKIAIKGEKSVCAIQAYGSTLEAQEPIRCGKSKAKIGSAPKLGRKGERTRPCRPSVPRLLCLATRRETDED